MIITNIHVPGGIIEITCFSPSSMLLITISVFMFLSIVFPRWGSSPYTTNQKGYTKWQLLGGVSLLEKCIMCVGSTFT